MEQHVSRLRRLDEPHETHMPFLSSVIRANIEHGDVFCSDKVSKAVDDLEVDIARTRPKLGERRPFRWCENHMHGAAGLAYRWPRRDIGSKLTGGTCKSRCVERSGDCHVTFTHPSAIRLRHSHSMP
jgi:hypothetical protein